MLPRTLSAHALAALLLGISLPAGAVSLQELAEARHALDVSEQVLERMQQQVTTAQADSSVIPAERQRLTDYLEHVRALVDANRERVKTLELQLGRQAGAGGPSAYPSTVITVAPVMTESDEASALEDELEASLSEFDELLLEEARKAREERPDGDGLGGGMAGAGAGGAGSGETGDSQTATAADKGLESIPEGPAPESTGEEAPDGGPPSPGDQDQTASRVPPDVGDGSDDDVVARQIRKAAESEPDPELRERLWEEYRKYKEGNRS
jgi:hypothetical protein